MKLPANYRKLTPRERRRVREEYILKQDGKCHHCGAPLFGLPSTKVLKMSVTTDLYPPNFFKHPIHLHHNHDTGMTIGAVHAHCNAVLWEHHDE